jgi:hypothetical protein
VGFEPTTSVFEREKTVHTSDPASYYDRKLCLYHIRNTSCTKCTVMKIPSSLRADPKHKRSNVPNHKAWPSYSSEPPDECRSTADIVGTMAVGWLCRRAPHFRLRGQRSIKMNQGAEALLFNRDNELKGRDYVGNGKTVL